MAKCFSRDGHSPALIPHSQSGLINNEYRTVFNMQSVDYYSKYKLTMETVNSKREYRYNYEYYN